MSDERTSKEKRRRMREVVERIQKYIATYSDQPDYDLYSDATFIKDMLYGIGVAIDPNEYRCADGFAKFRALILPDVAPAHEPEAIDDDHVCGVCEGTQRGVCNCKPAQPPSATHIVKCPWCTRDFRTPPLPAPPPCDAAVTALRKIIDEGDYTNPEGMKRIAREALENLSTGQPPEPARHPACATECWQIAHDRRLRENDEAWEEIAKRHSSPTKFAGDTNE